LVFSSTHIYAVVKCSSLLKQSNVGYELFKLTFEHTPDRRLWSHADKRATSQSYPDLPSLADTLRPLFDGNDDDVDDDDDDYGGRGGGGDDDDGGGGEEEEEEEK
jgi:hypothetical protein